MPFSKKSSVVLLIGIVALLTVAANAQRRVEARQARQQTRIARGVATGQLNPVEAARLEHQQARVEASQQRAQADGVVTAQERVRLERQQDRTSRAIARQRHDRH